jgi:hypothetical protein
MLIRIANAQLSYYMGIPDPDSLDDETWAMRFTELTYLRKKEAEANKVK